MAPLPVRRFSFLALAALAAGCATSASLPPAGTTLAPGQGAATYDRFKLTYESSALTGSRWKRADGEYMLGQMDKVLAAYPETKAGAERMHTRMGTIALVGGIGGGVLGFTFGRNVLAPERAHWSAGQQAAGYGVGAGLILTSFLLQALWTDSGPTTTETYNKLLHRDLAER
jgi:hypothetical protein